MKPFHIKILSFIAIVVVLAVCSRPVTEPVQVVGGMLGMILILFVLPFYNIILKNRIKAEKERLAQEQKAKVDRELSEQKAIRDQAEAKTRFEQKHQVEQERIRNTLLELESAKCKAIEVLPTAISQAEAALDLAVFEFSEGAFNPFWDAVENAITNLVSYDNGIRTIASTSKRIPEELGQLDSPPPYNISPKISLPKAEKTINRMRQIVRNADKNIDFATIFLQRRTNGILVAGFANLGTAISDMGSRIQGSIDGLALTIDASIAKMSKHNDDYYQASLSSMEAIREQLVSDSEASREHEAKDEEMQNNMQRRKMPIDKDFRDGQYPQ